MKKISFVLILILVMLALSACSKISGGKESSYSITIRNGGANEVVLKNVTVNDKTYLSQDMPLAAATSSKNSDYMVLFTSGQTVRVNAVIYDAVLDKETEISEKFIDNAGEGYAILIEYNAGAIATDTSTVGRLSAWGS